MLEVVEMSFDSNGAALRGLRLLTLNVAHGRRTGPHQALLKSPVLERNLRDIALAVKGLGPDVVALQEADGPSAWSGNFDHVATLARLADLGDFYRGEHNPWGLGRFRLSSGTALLARWPLSEPASQRFALSWRDTKGFVVATVAVPEWEGLEVDLASVHLDFLTPAARRRQIAHLVEALGRRQRPLVLLGDLNCCWRRDPRSMDLLTEELGLTAHQPHARVPTFPASRPRRRLDWILVSPELQFVAYRTLPVPLSDHLGVLAEVVPARAA
jgi:endonuclease/exonuclease/phosphatase family metal-dependent hydrolase